MFIIWQYCSETPNQVHYKRELVMKSPYEVQLGVLRFFGIFVVCQLDTLYFDMICFVCVNWHYLSCIILVLHVPCFTASYACFVYSIVKKGRMIMLRGSKRNILREGEIMCDLIVKLIILFIFNWYLFIVISLLSCFSKCLLRCGVSGLQV